jgi:hypothetical protein
LGVKPVWTVHALLGGPSTMVPVQGTALQTFQLPDGSHTSTRFLTAGASHAHGWPIECESLASGQFLLLHLGHAELSLHALTDELHPAFGLGFPRLGEVLSDLTARLSQAKITLRPGLCAIAPEPDEQLQPLVPKLKAQAKTWKLEVLPLEAWHPGQTAHVTARFLEGID